jgi:branched-subunit amino acid aminotransferase/4-amino-4-deoxychorismate lyase
VATLDGDVVDARRLSTLATVNYGHFTSMRVEHGGVRGLGLHFERLARDCRRVFDTELDLDRVRHYAGDAVAGATRPVVVRVTVFDPALDVGDAGRDAVPSVLVTLRPAPPERQPPLRLTTAVYQRELPEVKHVGLFGPVRLRRAARRGGADDVLFTDAVGTVCETSIANVGFIEGDRVVWPRADCLHGVTMRLITDITEITDMVDTATESVTVDRLGSLDAAFVTNAAVGVRPVGAIDDTRWAGEPSALRRIRERYADIRPEPL